MKAVLEFGGFLALALGAHLLIWQAGTTGGTIGEAGTAGHAGADTLALAGADADLQDLVADWDSPPPPAITPARLQPPAPDSAPQMPLAQQTAPGLPVPPPLTPALPTEVMDTAMVADTLPPPQPPPPPKLQPPVPEPKPEPIAKPAKPAAPAAKPKAATKTERTKGQASNAAGQTSAGQNGGGQKKPGTQAQASEMARWGGAIRKSIERSKRRPATGNAKGAVSLAISVSTNGALTGLAVAKSSGDGVLDRAAVDAVKRARLPKAPADIPPGTHRFTLSVSFTR